VNVRLILTLKLGGIYAGYAVTAFSAAPAAKEAVLSHMGFFNIPWLEKRTLAGCPRQHGKRMIAQNWPFAT